jgi:uncharacterized protein
MIRKHLHREAPFRIFAISSLITAASLGAIFYFLGPAAALVTAVLIVVEVTFSFENAIINAKVLATLSKFWQVIFLTIGILIAVFGMRVLFPLLIVALGAQLSMSEVLDLALHNPDQYAHSLEKAAPSIEAFGGMFLFMLAAHFFIWPEKKLHWLKPIERPLATKARRWTYIIIGLAVLIAVSIVPFNPHPQETFIAGSVGLLAYLIIHGLTELSSNSKALTSGTAKTGLAGLIGFLYLEVLDASFSLDGVIGAFAVTNQVVLIAAGLGVGALWVRSMTVYMVRKKTLKTYEFIEHGAHYTIFILSMVLLIGLFVPLPGSVVGFLGVIIIGLSVLSSMKANRKRIKI